MSTHDVADPRSHPDDARQFPRVPLNAPATAPLGAEELVGSIRDVSLGGALMIVPGEAHVPAGSGLEVAFRLPHGAHVRAASSVRWTKVGSSHGSTSVGLQFRAMSGPTRAYLSQYIEEVAIAGLQSPIRADATTKFKVTFDTCGRLRLLLSGVLTTEEAQAFTTFMEARLGSRRGRQLHFELDARALSVCQVETVAQLRRGFDVIAAHGDVFGLLVAPASLALTQLLRAAREAGLADSVFSVDDVGAAERIWQQMDA